MSPCRAKIAGVLAVAGLWLGWDLAVYVGWLDADLFPPLSKVLARAIQLSVDGDFLTRDVGSSLRRLLAASLMALPLALVGGWLAGMHPLIRAVINPFVNFTLPLPKVAIFPLMLAVFGLGDSSKIALIAIGMFYPLFINVLHGTLRLAASDLRDLTRIYAIRGADLYRQVYAKGLLADILVGLKASLGYGFTLVIVSELSASNNGIGHFIWRSWDAFQILDMYAAVFWLCAMGWIVQSGLDIALARRLRMNPSRT